jgi:hypothetical protein
VCSGRMTVQSTSNSRNIHLCSVVFDVPDMLQLCAQAAWQRAWWDPAIPSCAVDCWRVTVDV